MTSVFLFLKIYFMIQKILDTDIYIFVIESTIWSV